MATKVRKLLLCLALTGCGAPGADAVFSRATPKAAGTDSARPAVRAQPPKPRFTPKPVRGQYLRKGEESTFRPCGRREALDVTGSAEGRYLLAERYRWNAVWQGRATFAVLVGGIVTDTVKTANRGGDTTRSVVTRFFVTGVDSLRTWQQGDCGGRTP